MILGEVGPPGGPLTLIYKEGDQALADDALLVRDTLAPYGIALDLVSLSGALGRRIVESGDFDLYLATRTADIPSADMWLGRFMDGASTIDGNPAFFTHERAGALVREIADTVGKDDDGPNDRLRVETERAAKLAELADIAMTEAPYVFLYQLETTLVLDEMVKLWVNKKIVEGHPHPAWPDIWPIDQTVLRPPDFRSGANPTGKRPEPAGEGETVKMPSIQSILK
jgi:peptide/nickel transport system substrate-binding protein